MDLESIQRYALNVWQAMQGEMVPLMIQLGDRLGLFAPSDAKGGTRRCESLPSVSPFDRLLSFAFSPPPHS